MELAQRESWSAAGEQLSPSTERCADESRPADTTTKHPTTTNNAASISTTRCTSAGVIQPAAAATAESDRRTTTYALRRERYRGGRHSASPIAELSTSPSDSCTSNTGPASPHVSCGQMGPPWSASHDQERRFGHKSTLSGDGFGYNGAGHAGAWVRSVDHLSLPLLMVG